MGRPPKSALTHSAVSTRVWIEMGSAQVSMATRLDASLDSREICVILPGHARPSQTGDCSGNCSGCRFRWVCMGEQLSMPRPYFPTTYLSMQVGPTSVLKPFKAWVAGSNPAALTIFFKRFGLIVRPLVYSCRKNVRKCLAKPRSTSVVAAVGSAANVPRGRIR